MFLLRKARESLNSFPRVRAAAHLLSGPFRRQKKEIPEREYCSLLPQFVAEPMFVKVGANDRGGDYFAVHATSPLRRLSSDMAFAR